jgi:hypothetical protein
VENYFNYFTEIEEHFQQRRGSLLLLSTLDWALIETWKDAGIPLEAVLRGIDDAFDKYAQRPSKTRKVNSVAYCSQAVMAAAEEMKEASIGTAQPQKPREKGFQTEEIVDFLLHNAALLESARLPEKAGISVRAVAHDSAGSLRQLAMELEQKGIPSRLEDLERRLTVLEEKLFAVLLAAIPDDEILTVRGESDRELAPYRRKMPAAQIEQLQKQYTHKRLLEQYNLPRLSLFYM